MFRDAPERWTEGPPFRPEQGAEGGRLRVLAYDVALPRELLFPPLINVRASSALPRQHACHAAPLTRKPHLPTHLAG